MKQLSHRIQWNGVLRGRITYTWVLHRPLAVGSVFVGFV